MHVDPFFEAAVRCLRAGGHRLTRSRLDVLAALSRAQRPLSPCQLLEMLGGPARPFDRMTLYRTLELLYQARLVHRLAFAGGYLPCRLGSEGCHHHVVCRACGRAVELECHGLSTAERTVEVASGYRIERHFAEFTGLCPGCLNDSAGLPALAPGYLKADEADGGGDSRTVAA